MIDSKAWKTRCSNPGLLGSNGVSISFDTPDLWAARKNCLRRTRNLDASKSDGKSATSTAHASSYSVHSGLRSLGSLVCGSGKSTIFSLFSAVCLAQGNDAHLVTSHNIDKHMQSIANHPAQDESVLAIIKSLVGRRYCCAQVNVDGLREWQSTRGRVLLGLFFIPLEITCQRPTPSLVRITVTQTMRVVRRVSHARTFSENYQ